MNQFVMPPEDTYKKCPFCNKKLPKDVISSRRLMKIVICPHCNKIIPNDHRVY